MRSTFKVLFYLKCNAPKKDGLIPVMCRITINGKIAQFSCKLDVEEKSWNVELGRVSGRSIAAQETNRMLDKIRVGINQAYQKIADRDNYVTAEKVRNACTNTSRSSSKSGIRSATSRSKSLLRHLSRTSSCSCG